MVIVDTTVWIDYLRGIENAQTDWLDNALTHRRLGFTDLILCEVLQGIRGDPEFNEVRKNLLRFEVFETGGTDLAIAAARNYRNLRERGHTVRKTIDCLIATFCLLAGHELLHRDRDYDVFERFLKLRVVHAN